MRIHFICRGNAYRSIIAEAYLKSLQLPDVDVVSSGIVADDYSEQNVPVREFTYEYLKRKGLEAYAKRPWTQLAQDSINDSDITICMNQRVFNECGGLLVMPQNTIIWDINDNDPEETENPPRNNQELMVFTDKVFEQISNKVDTLVQQLP